MCSSDLSPEAFPHMSVRDGVVAGVPARVFRVSYTGEVSYEVCVPTDRGQHVWQALAEAGQKDGIAPVGIDAWMLLRTEKGYLHVGSDTDGTTTPDDIGWGHIHRRADDFVGRRSLLRPANTRADRFQLVGLEVLELRPSSLQCFELGVELFAGHEVEPREDVLHDGVQALLHVLARARVAHETAELLAEAADPVVVDHRQIGRAHV